MQILKSLCKSASVCNWYDGRRESFSRCWCWSRGRVTGACSGCRDTRALFAGGCCIACGELAAAGPYTANIGGMGLRLQELQGKDSRS